MEEINQPSIFSFQPVTDVLQFLASYGWWLLGAGVASLYALSHLQPYLEKRRQAQEDAEYHKDPDVALQRMEAIERARKRQQELLEEASQRHLAQQKEREEKKKADLAERLRAAGSSSGQRLGARDEYLPLTGAGGSSGYRAPKKSKCGGGGCGR